MGTYRLKLKAGNTFEQGQRYFRELAVLLDLDKKFTFLEPVRLVRDLDPIPEADIAARLRRLLPQPPQNALPSPETAHTLTPDDGPQMPAGKKPAHNKLTPRTMKAFQKNLITTVLWYVGKFGKDDIPSLGRIHKVLSGDLTDSKWRSRRERTMKDWGCPDWEALFLRIVNTSEELGSTAWEDIFFTSQTQRLSGHFRM
jgi:hypothetical protein